MTTPSAPEAPSSPAPARATLTDPPVATPRRSGKRRAVRFLGTSLIALGIGAVAWTILVWQWQDPFTALYTLYQQHKLSGRYHKVADAYRPLLAERTRQAGAGRSGVSVAEERALIRRDAVRYHKSLRPGTPVGRIKVRRLGLSIVVVTGTDHDSLTKGPGWDTRTYLPGEGKLIYIAGHRTTYLAPFAQIDSMRPGDLVRIEVPYGTFVYRVRNHVIVPSDDVARLRSSNRPAGTPPGEVVALQACHPRFFATHRYIVYAVLARVVPRGGRPYTVR